MFVCGGFVLGFLVFGLWGFWLLLGVGRGPGEAGQDHEDLVVP